MKQAMLFIVLAVVACGFSFDAHSSVTEIATDTAKTVVKQVVFHPIKSAILAILAYDAYIHGIKNCLVFKTGEFVWQNSQQLIENGQVLLTSVKNVGTAVVVAGSSAMALTGDKKGAVA